MFEKKKEEKELIKRLDKINYTLSQNNILELIELLGNRKKFFFRNFWSGIIKGIGTGIGFTILTAILLVVLQKIVALNLPVISEYILDIIEIVKIKMLCSSQSFCYLNLFCDKSTTLQRERPDKSDYKALISD